MNDIRAEVRFKNNRLWEALNSTFCETAKQMQRGGLLPLIKTASEAIGISHQLLGEYLNFGIAAYRPDGSPKSSASIISKHLELPVEFLFPRHLCASKSKTKKAIRTFDSYELIRLAEAKRLAIDTSLEESIDPTLADVLDEALLTLSPREQVTLRRRFGLDGEEETLEEIGNHLGISIERVRQIEAKAIRKLRAPSRSGPLRVWV